MDATQLTAIVASRLFLAWIFTWILKGLVKIFLPFSIPYSCLYLICLAYSIQIKVVVNKPSQSEPSQPDPKSSSKCVHLELGDGLTEVKKELGIVEELLEAYGTLIEQSGIVCREAFTQIYREQKEQLRQYNDFRRQYADQFGSIVNVLEGHRKDIAETSRAATEDKTSLCEIIGQYRQIVEDNQKFVRVHIDSVTETLKTQHTAVTRHEELADSRDDAIQDTLRKQSKKIEHNSELIQEHGTSIDNVVSAHADLVAEYQKALDGLALLITANRIFSSIHEAPQWKSFGDHTRRVVAEEDLTDETKQLQLTQDHEKRISHLQLGTASANVVDNVHQIARTFRGTYDDMITAMNEKPEGMRHRDWLAGRRINSLKVDHDHHRNPDTTSGVGQLMATVFGQLRDTLQSTVEARHAEAMGQLRRGQEDMERLRAEIGDIQGLRRQVREAQARRERLSEQDREIRALREEIRRLRGDVCQHVRDGIDQVLAESHSSTTATSNVTAFRDGDTLTAAAVTDPTDVTDSFHIPAAAPTHNDDAEALDASGPEAEMVVDDEEDNGAGSDCEGRLMGDFLGCMMSREDWPDKKKSRRKTRKMYAIAKQRAGEQAEE